MFQFPGFASATYGFSDGYRTNAVGFPIRRSWDQRLLAPPPSISQRATSFIASQRQGIHQMPFVTCSTSQNAPHSSDRPALPHATMRNEPFADASTHHRAHPCAPKARIHRPIGQARGSPSLLVTRSPDTTPYDDKHHEEPTRRYRIVCPSNSWSTFITSKHDDTANPAPLGNRAGGPGPIRTADLTLIRGAL